MVTYTYMFVNTFSLFFCSSEFCMRYVFVYPNVDLTAIDPPLRVDDYALVGRIPHLKRRTWHLGRPLIVSL